MGISLKRLGYSMNTENPDEINKAKDELIKELDVVQAYVNDDGKDRIVAGDADMGIVYSGDALVMMDENTDIDNTIPQEKTNKNIKFINIINIMFFCFIKYNLSALIKS